MGIKLRAETFRKSNISYVLQQNFDYDGLSRKGCELESLCFTAKHIENLY